ncbi:Intraflagellar transport protein 172-like [Hondaea fermentalgiana]|uniref:Intraflagellar transport protein 172-like n=1 Tax=Hondaea fermentalgiana TaxID=2315210 RepID=A0A2R5G9E3_9STRA|nr:Intraflagellar transport protein 172-like [Hondaea fermentalgiana]|eukprot:GBG27682.1 Intraflagellar transport protein 172-like [Hondaea fermentalgiana]
MQLTLMQSLLEPSKQGMKKVTAMSWSPNNKRLAVVTVDRVVYLYDEQGERKDKFATKAATKGDKEYLVRALAWSPDSSKLAVAQTDNIVFVYKLGLEWTDKKSIRHKFAQSSTVTCLTWPSGQPNELVFGLADGKVKVGQLRSNKPATLYSTDSYTVACCASTDGKSILSGHLDGAIYCFNFDEVAGGSGAAYRKFAHHPCPPYALAWGTSVMAAGSDRRVVFYDDHGSERRTFDYALENAGDGTNADKDSGETGTPPAKEFTVAASNPSGQSIVVGNFDSFYVFTYSAARESWEEMAPKVIPNYYTVTSLAWKQDGSRLAVGTLCGAVDVFDACIRRTRYNNTFEFTYVSPSQVIVKHISSGRRVMIKSAFECEITRINVYAEDRYLVAHTSETLICGDIETAKMSEVPWNFVGTEKYVFDNPNVCMVYASGELAMIEYGHNEILSSCRTEHVRNTLVSVRINERPPRARAGLGGAIPMMSTRFGESKVGAEASSAAAGTSHEANKKIAYLLDQLTIRVMDLATGYADATINHNSKIDWLELNARADLLLYRDKRRQLHLYNVHKQSRNTLLTYCNYVQWVPGSDVVVAQNRGNLCVWYNIEAPEKVTIIPIQGEVEEIERVEGKTEVRVDEGINTAVYCLDEALIGFGSAVEDNDLDKAMRVLELQSVNGEFRPETETMWKQLSEVARAAGRLDLAERSYAAVGDVSMARYMRKVNKTRMQVRKATGTDGDSHWIVRARLALLQGDFRDAELIYLEQGQSDEAVEMYQTLHQWDEAIRVAEERNHPEAEDMRASYFDYLVSSGQEARAGAIREREGDYVEAIDLYLRGSRPAKAVYVVNTYKKSYKADLLERIATALTNSGMHDKAGSFYERNGQMERALQSFKKGHAYRSAVELARREFPDQVIRLEEMWGDWLVQTKNLEPAIGHFIEANATRKAIEAALGSRQWTKAGQLVDSLGADEETTRPYYRRIADHYHQAQQFERAEKYYTLAGAEKEAIQMYTDAGQWDNAHALATRFMSSQEVSDLYHRQAQTLEGKGRYKEAERLLLTVDAVDRAIAMYEKARKFDHMIRLVAAYRKEKLKDTHLRLAGRLEMEGNLRQAEEHFAQSGDWPSAVNMYTANDKWDEAIRVAKYHGGVSASRKVAYQWAKVLGGEAGAKLLTKLGLVEQAIDYAIDDGAYSEALELAKNSLPARVPEVHLKHALYLEDEERFTEAEAAFIKAEKPKEAIEMYNHQQDWSSAMRVAERYDPASVPDVLVAQAKHAVGLKQFSNAETLFLNAKKPEFALAMFQEHGLWEEAIRFAKMHLPHKLQEVQRAFKEGGSVSVSLAASKAVAAPRNSPPPSGRRSPKASYNPASGRGARIGALGDCSRQDAIRSAMDSAKNFEEAGEFTKAIDCFLHTGESAEGEVESQPSSEEVDLMVIAWDRAIRLSSQHAADSYGDVVEHVADRLAGVGRFNAAGDLYEEVERHEEAVRCYIKAKKWDKARAVAEIAPAYLALVDKAYRKHMRHERNPAELLKLGDYDAALALHADQGDWERIFEIIDTQEGIPVELGSKYAGEMAARLVENVELGEVPVDKLDHAIARLAKHGTPSGPQHFALFCRLAQEVLGRKQADIRASDPDQDGEATGEDSTDDVGPTANGAVTYDVALRNLREVLFNAIRQRSNSRRLESKSAGESQIQTLERLLLVTHLYRLHYTCVTGGSMDLAAKILVVLLRFKGDAIPCDKIFYLAGMACKDMEWLGKAFVILNRYLDLSEAIDEGELGDLDNTDFQDTDIPEPHKNPLPKSHFLPDNTREEIREWILSAAMDADVEQEPLDQAWFQETTLTVAENTTQLVRMFERGAMPIEEYLVDIRSAYGL